MNTLAEREGFEPSIRRKPYNALAGRPLRPLGHLSGSLFLLLLLDIPRWEGSPPVAAGGAKCARLLSSRAQSALGHSGISPGVCFYYYCSIFLVGRDRHQWQQGAPNAPASYLPALKARLATRASLQELFLLRLLDI